MESPTYGPTDPRTDRPISREDVAKLEIGVTDVTPGIARTLCAMFIALVCVIPFFELSRAASGDTAAAAPWQRLAAIPSEARAREGLFDTNRAVLEGLHEFEDSLEDESRLGQMLRPGAQQLLTGLLGAGNEQAYVGKEGWLFFRQDVEYVTGHGFLEQEVLGRRVRNAEEWTNPPQPDPRPAIVELHRDLASRGVTLIVVPVPVKPTVHPEMLAPAHRFDTLPQNPDYARFVNDLRGEGVLVFEPSALVQQARSASDVSQYLATDTHWRPETMEIVAIELADTIRDTVGLTLAANPGYRAVAADVSNRGDVFGMLDLPATQTLFEEETVTVRRILRPDGSPWRSSPDADVLVLGDSFANIYSLESMGWGTSAGLVEQLSFALGRPLDRMVQNDAGSYATREMLARAEPQRLATKRVVVYQFAVRELAFGDWKLIAGR